MPNSTDQKQVTGTALSEAGGGDRKTRTPGGEDTECHLGVLHHGQETSFSENVTLDYRLEERGISYMKMVGPGDNDRGHGEGEMKE